MKTLIFLVFLVITSVISASSAETKTSANYSISVARVQGKENSLEFYLHDYHGGRKLLSATIADTCATYTIPFKRKPFAEKRLPDGKLEFTEYTHSGTKGIQAYSAETNPEGGQTFALKADFGEEFKYAKGEAKLFAFEGSDDRYEEFLFSPYCIRVDFENISGFVLDHKWKSADNPREVKRAQDKCQSELEKIHSLKISPLKKQDTSCLKGTQDLTEMFPDYLGNCLALALAEVHTGKAFRHLDFKTFVSTKENMPAAKEAEIEKSTEVEKAKRKQKVDTLRSAIQEKAKQLRASCG